MSRVPDRVWPRRRGPFRVFAWLVGLLVAGTGVVSEAGVSVDDLLTQAQTDDLRGDHTNALVLVRQAIAAAPTNAQCYYVRGRIYSNQREHAKALADFDKVLQMEPRAGRVYQFRGLEQFRLGHFDEAIADFDKYLQYVPRSAPFHWQRGVACYFAGRYDEARKQFELHHLVNSNDVENAAWHFAAVARAQSVAAAQAALLTGLKDRRVPMMHIYALFKGRLKPDDVLQAARAGHPPPIELKQRLFHAHYYIGLYYEATGEPGLAREHILVAADDYAPPTYIGDVARVHAELYRKKSG